MLGGKKNHKILYHGPGLTLWRVKGSEQGFGPMTETANALMELCFLGKARLVFSFPLG